MESASPRVGVVLCGCGRFDGSEIHESVLTLLNLVEAGATPVCLAPDEEQWAVCDHFSGEAREGESRNMLQESARIARGEVQTLASANAGELDALILPGGSGAAKNLCDFAAAGAEAKVHPDLAELIRQMHAAGKPIGAICIAPAIVALVLGDQGVSLTLGGTDGAAEQAAQTGAKMIPSRVDQIVVDEVHRVVSTPAYILAQNIAETQAGIRKLVAQVLAFCAVPS
ncbi:MAG: isoprenoid biosynthesis protein ElbB [Planctomycetota bacterium]|nr:MAG: isoprenoid biosynthesis protein ElbB [Planctomycetota bacterium]